jgi:AbrB family looped-hinge helix DNA binding protein
MAKSKITTKNQTTVPREVRKRLGVGPGDELEWHVEGGRVEVSFSGPVFLARRGTISVGPGSVVDDIRRSRSERGR